jgi:hypothetical protein
MAWSMKKRGRQMTFVGLSVYLIAVVPFVEGSPKQGLEGIALGTVIIVFSEWTRWRGN